MSDENGSAAAGEGSGAAEALGRRVRRSTRYPRYDLKESESLAQMVFDLGMRHVHQHEVATRLGFSGVDNGAYKGRRAAARYFGLVDYSGDEYISVAEPWISALHGEDPNEISRARQEAALVPDLYRQLFEAYRDRMLPPVERLARQLVVDPSYGITRDAASDAAQTFVASFAYAGLLDTKGFLHEPGWDQSKRGHEAESPEASDESATSGGRGDARAAEGAGVGASRAASPSSTTAAVEADVGYDRLEIRLRGARKVFLLIPEPGYLSTDDKIRIKGHIDLILEDEDE